MWGMGREARRGALCFVRLLSFVGHLDVAERDRRPFAHAAEDTLRNVIQVSRGVELGDLACVEDADTVVSNDCAQAVCIGTRA